MTIQEYIKDGAALLGSLGGIAAVLAHLPFIPAKYAEWFARFASYASQSAFSVNKREPPVKPNESDAPPVHITLVPDTRPDNQPPDAALRSLALA